jgi:hypothetical protein
MAYRLEGHLLEACDCRVLCPSWIGDAPDNDSSNDFVSWRFDKPRPPRHR